MDYTEKKFKDSYLCRGGAYRITATDDIDIWDEKMGPDSYFDAILLEKSPDQLVFIRYSSFEKKNHHAQLVVVLPDMPVELKELG
jgi:hypothetical protein